MYPFIRLSKTIIKAMNGNRKGDTLELTDTGEIQIRSNPTDMDNFFEMNNGRVLTLFDLGRSDFAVRCGLAKILLKKRWGLVIAGSSIQYRKRVYAFSKITIKTRLVGIDNRWIYIEQSMWVKGQPTSSALLRTGITNLKTGKVIETEKILTALGKQNFEMPLEGWVQSWTKADKERLWPSTSNNEDN